MKKIKTFFKKIYKYNYRKYIKTNILFLSFVIMSVINGCMLRFTTVGNYFELKPILADLAFSIIIGSFGYLFKPQNQFKYYLTISIMFVIVCIINSVYYTNYLSYVSVSLLATSLQLFGVGDAVTQNIMEIDDFYYIWQIFAMILVHVNLNKKSYYKLVAAKNFGVKRFKQTLIGGIVCLVLFIITLTSLDIGRITKQWNREYIVRKFGIYTYQISDLIYNSVFKVTNFFGYDSSLKVFREYYSSKDNSTTTNDYTNIFKGKNVLVIHAESIQQYTMNLSFNGKELTPNLNKLAKEGIYFSNFYSQESVGTSSDTEFTFNTSLMPAVSGTVFINYWNREYVTLPKLLKEQDYYTFSMHGNNGTFWNRNVMHEQLGYDNFYYHTKDYEIDETIGLGLSDKSFFRQSVPKIKEISENYNNFYGVLIMLTNHTPFSYINDYSDYSVDYEVSVTNPITNKTTIKSYPFLEGKTLGNYFKSVHYADEAIGQFINDLDEEGLLDNTVIVIYGDHDSKIKKSEYEYFYNYDPVKGEMLSKDAPDYHDVSYFEYELNRKVPFIIWTKDQTFGVEVKEAMGMYDAMPTLGNMFGFKSEYALGHDIFSVTDNIVVFPGGNWLTNKMYYNSQKQEGILLNPSTPVSLNYIEKNNAYAEKMITVSNAIINYDLIRSTKGQSSVLKYK